jgi:hypothetical protein
VEWRPTADRHGLLDRLVAAFSREAGVPALTSLLTSDLSVPLPLHVSLSASLSVPGQQREALLARLRRAVREEDVRTFIVKLGPRIKFVNNGSGTRYFVAVGAHAEGNELNRLLWACNEACVDQGFPALYVSPDGVKERVDRTDWFHFSLAWCLGGKDVHAEKVQAIVNKVWEQQGEELRDVEVEVNKILVKMGNIIHEIELKKS